MSRPLSVSLLRRLLVLSVAPLDAGEELGSRIQDDDYRQRVEAELKQYGEGL